MFLAITRTVLFDQTAASSSMNRALTTFSTASAACRAAMKSGALHAH